MKHVNNYPDFEDETYPYFSDIELRERAYSFHLVLYPDSTDYQFWFTMQLIHQEAKIDSNFVYAYILHDQEKDEKEHYHVCIKWNKQHSLKSVLDKFDLRRYNCTDGIPEIRKWRDMLNYIIHNTKNSKNKYQYPTSEVISNIDDVIKELRFKRDNQDSFYQIYDFIQSEPYMTMSKVVEYCRHDQALHNVLVSRQYGYLISNLVKERQGF